MEVEWNVDNYEKNLNRIKKQGKLRNLVKTEFLQPIKTVQLDDKCSMSQSASL